MMTFTKRRPGTLPMGTYANATTKTEDWINGLRWALDRTHLAKQDRASVRRLLREYDALDREDWDQFHETADPILDELREIADNYTPPYAYLGTLEGDGAEFGVWASIESLQDAIRDGDVWKACPRGDGYSKPGTIRLDVPRGDLYVVVSDHGNVSLYQSQGKDRAREIWGVV